MRVLLLLLFATSVIPVAACGARTGLLSDSTEPVDAGLDAPKDPGVVDCQDAGTTYIYLISSESQLVRFYPPDLSVTTIGTINCPGGSVPSSMAVDRNGVAYVRLGGSEIFRVSTRTASCKPPGFVVDPSLFPPKFGMGYSANADDPGEALYIASEDNGIPGETGALARVDPATSDISVVGSLSKPIGDIELTGTSDARLFAFGLDSPKSHLAELDKTTADVKSDVLIDFNQSKIDAWAFAFWGGDFYFFTSDQPGTSAVHRYTPGGSTTPPLIKTINLTIVGAGVSTCAPSE